MTSSQGQGPAIPALRLSRSCQGELRARGSALWVVPRTWRLPWVATTGPEPVYVSRETTLSRLSGEGTAPRATSGIDFTHRPSRWNPPNLWFLLRCHLLVARIAAAVNPGLKPLKHWRLSQGRGTWACAPAGLAGPGGAAALSVMAGTDSAGLRCLLWAAKVPQPPERVLAALGRIVARGPPSPPGCPGYSRSRRLCAGERSKYPRWPPRGLWATSARFCQQGGFFGPP